MKNFKIIVTASVVFVFCLTVYKLFDANNSIIPMSSSNGIHTFVATDTIARTPSGLYVYTQIVKLDDNLHKKFSQDGTPKEFMRTVGFMGSNKIFSVTLVSDDGWSDGMKYPILTKLNNPGEKELNFVRNYHKQHGDPNVFVKSWALALAMWLMFGIAYYNFASKPTCKTTGEKLLVTGRVSLSLAIVVAIPNYILIYNNWRNFHYSGRVPYLVTEGIMGIVIGIILLLALIALCSFLPSRIMKYFETDMEYRERLERERQALLSYMQLQKNVKRFGLPMLRIVTGTGSVIAAFEVLSAIMQDKHVDLFKAVSASLGIEELSDLTDTMDGVVDVFAESSESVNETNEFLANAADNIQTYNIQSPTNIIHSDTDIISNVDTMMSPDNIFSQLSVIGTNDSGFETVSYNADNHTFYNHDGREIARVQGYQVVDNMNNVIARYDPHTGNILDSNGNPLNIAQTGDTFKTVMDVHGNGIETINGEVFDAKTHERIGNIHKA